MQEVESSWTYVYVVGVGYASAGLERDPGGEVRGSAARGWTEI